MTQNTLFIHTGGSKTGSSTLQKFCYLNSSKLNKLGFAFENRLIPEFGANNGLLLYTTLATSSPTDNELDTLISSYFGQSPNALCSSEYFQLFDTSNWRKIVDSCSRLGLTIKIIFYIRNALPFFLSSYDQSVKHHGEHKPFDQWVVEQDWQHVSGLRKMADEIPKENIRVLHYEQEKNQLAESFLISVGIYDRFAENTKDQNLRVNRSLTNQEREILSTVNRVFGNLYSTELTKLFLHNNADLRAEPVIYEKKTADILISRYQHDVDWVNNTFFEGRPIVSVLPIKSTHHASRKLTTESFAETGDAAMAALQWVLEKMKTVQIETRQRLVSTLTKTAQITSDKFQPDIPPDFDPLAYLLLNPDVLEAGMDPQQHFLKHGRQEGRKFKW